MINGNEEQVMEPMLININNITLKEYQPNSTKQIKLIVCSLNFLLKKTHQSINSEIVYFILG